MKYYMIMPLMNRQERMNNKSKTNMKILVISDNYPSTSNPTNGVFVFNLVQQFAKLGHEVTVIAPFQVVPRKIKIKRQDYGKDLVRVYRPLFTSASTKQIGGFNTYSIARKQQVFAIKRIVKRHKMKFDIVYSHFIKNALLAIEALDIYNKPFITAVGENRNIELVQKWYNKKDYFTYFKKINKFVAVSEVIKEKLIAMQVIENKIEVRPNGVDSDIYYKRPNKKELRKKYNLPQDKLLIIFIGHFIESKGPLRLIEATKDRKNTGLIFVGNGKQNLESDLIVFKQKVPRNQVPELLSAADIFVLPTQHEGSNNAIIEAMACGLPIISSAIPEVKVQCDSSFSILTDPNNVIDIKEAINKIAADENLRIEMSKNAILHSKKFSIQERAEKIINFIKNNN